MLRSDLIKRLALEHPGLTRADTARVVQAVFDRIAAHLADGGRVELRGFGTFGVRKLGERGGRNLQTGAVVTVRATRRAFFKVGKELRERLNSR